MDINPTKVACIGAGYVGGPTMAVLAAKCPHITVHVVDLNATRIAAWNSDKLPIFEPGLDEVVRSCRGKNLFFSTDVAKAIKECDIIYISVNTPTKKTGIGAGAAADLCYWELCARSIAEHAYSDKIIIEKSTVPVRTAEAVTRVLRGSSMEGRKFAVLSNPEFLAEGTAINDLVNPDRVLVGAPRTPEGIFAQQIVVDMYSSWVPRERILTTNVWSSELSKLAANAFLAQRVSSINSISMLCRKTGADVQEVAKAIGFDSRIGPKFLNASVGFGGSCFQKDILNLVYLCETQGLPEVAAYWRQVVIMNDLQKRDFAYTIIQALFNTVRGKKLAIFGTAFKKDTGDVRETPAVDVCKILLEDGATLQWYDPKVEETDLLNEFKEHLGHEAAAALVRPGQNFSRAPSALAACEGADAIVILTEWDEFRSFDFRMALEVMRRPACLFDGRNIVDHARMHAMGFEVHRVGAVALYNDQNDSLLFQ